MIPFESLFQLQPPSSQYCSLVAGIAASPAARARVAMLLGYHPELSRDLTEGEERAESFSPLLAPNTRITVLDEFGEALSLWQRCWGAWRPPSSEQIGTVGQVVARWESVADQIVPLSAAYIFESAGPERWTPTYQEARRRVYDETFCRVLETTRAHSDAVGRPWWVDTFHPGRELRLILEHICGLTVPARARLGLDGEHDGFLLRYAAAHREPLDALLTPRQFEVLTADLFRAEGWACRVTPYSRDGGIDVEASRLIDGKPSIVLIQAKCYRSGSDGRRARPVRLDEVKAFAATVRGERLRDGIMVSSSYVTRDAVRWARTSGARVANLAFVDGPQLRGQLDGLARRFDPGDMRSFFLEVRGCQNALSIMALQPTRAAEPSGRRAASWRGPRG